MHLKFIAILTIFILLFASVIVNSERINIRSSFKQDLIPSYTFHDNLKTLNENVTKLLAYAPKAFTENRGQLSNKDVRFYAQDGSVWFTNDGVWIDLREEAPIYNQQSIVHGLESRIKTDDWRPTTRDYKRIILKQEFIGANIVEPYGKNPMEFYSNFFYGNDSSKWKTKVPSYQEIYYENIYDNIDLKYYRSEAGLKYDFIMYPGADIYQIRIRFKGADGLDIDQFSDIIIKTSMGNIIDYDLFIYQDYDDSRHSIEGSFKILNNLEYGFELSGDYNPLEVLVIDPTVELEYSTFLGAESYCVAITVDNNGSAIVTGSTQSSTFPTTPGAYDTSFNDPQGWWDIFVTKFNPNGSALIFSTYIGGSNGNYLDWAHDIAMDADGNVFLTGETYCLDYPTTKGAFNTSKTSKKGSAFVTKLNADGTKLIYSTFIHGTSIREDCGNSIVVDTFGNAFVTGYTYSSDFPTTPGAYDTSFDVGTDVFILKLNPSGTALNYSTFIGGTSIDSGIGIVIDDIGNAYVTGGTSSSDFPTTDGAYDTSHNDNYDGFILKLDQNGSSLIFSTVIGGNDDDGCGDIALNKNGNIIVVGDTQSLNFPTTNNAIDKTFNGGSYDIFIAILNKTGASLNYSTYLGGNNTETTYNIVVNSFGEIYITGFTNSSNFPTTYDAFNNSYMNSNMFLAQLNQNGSELMYSTFIYGGRGFGEGIAIDDFNNVYIGGNTGASDFPTTPGAYDTTFNGASTYGNVFVMKWFRNNIHSINSVSLKRDSLQVSKVYSKVGSYTFNVNLINTISSIDLKRVGIILFPHGNNIKLQWDRSTGLFSKLNDPNNYVTLEPSSKIYNDYWDKWSIDFNVTFNWTYPDEALQDVQAYVTSATISPALFNATEMFSVENDLIFNGTLSVKGEDNRVLKENDLVRGNEVLTWTGLRVIYEGTIDLFPPEEEYNITIWDESGDLWEVSPGLGEFFILQTLTTPHTDLDGDKHIINISGIPSECDGTNTSLILKIDNDNVTFTYATPNNETWHRDSTVDVGINISDIGGGYVDGTKVMYTVSTNNGTTWNDWILAPSMTSATTIRVKTVSDFGEGTNNFIKWRASDILGNGPVDSEAYRVRVDTQSVIFSDPWPPTAFESLFYTVEVGITISDNTSGVNASSIEYSISNNNGETWRSWSPVTGYKDGMKTVVRIKLTFQNGTNNRIRWRASDIAGNGPMKSEVYSVNVWASYIIPQVNLISPSNDSIITSTTVTLFWELGNGGQTLDDVTYNVFLDIVTPPELYLREVNKNSIAVNNLLDGESYFWKIIPIIKSDEGLCLSGIWSFTINTKIPKPIVKLISPKNGTSINSIEPNLKWFVDFDNIKIVTYDIYLSTDKNPKLKIKEHPNTDYYPENMLEAGKTYYWKIVPKAGSVTGPESEIWSFSIGNLFEIELVLTPTIVELKPGENTTVKAIISNLAEVTDTIFLDFNIPGEAGIEIILNCANSKSVEPQMTTEFELIVKSRRETAPKEIIVNIEAISEKAINSGFEVKSNANLTIKIIEDKQVSKADNLFLILLIIIVLIMILVFIVIIIKRKKKSGQESQPIKASLPETEKTQSPEKVPEIETAAPTTIPTVDTIEVDSTPPIQATPNPIPGQTPLLQMSEVPAQAPTQPQLEATTTMTTPTSQMAQVQPLPQLPPVQIETPQQLPIEPEIIQPQPATETQQQKKPSIEEEVDEKINGQKNN